MNYNAVYKKYKLFQVMLKLKNMVEMKFISLYFFSNYDKNEKIMSIIYLNDVN